MSCLISLICPFCPKKANRAKRQEQTTKTEKPLPHGPTRYNEDVDRDNSTHQTPQTATLQYHSRGVCTPPPPPNNP